MGSLARRHSLFLVGSEAPEPQSSLGFEEKEPAHGTLAPQCSSRSSKHSGKRWLSLPLEVGAKMSFLPPGSGSSGSWTMQSGRRLWRFILLALQRCLSPWKYHLRTSSADQSKLARLDCERPCAF